MVRGVTFQGITEMTRDLLFYALGSFFYIKIRAFGIRILIRKIPYISRRARSSVVRG